MREVRRPIHCIVPPHVLERVIRNGNAEQREWATATLMVDHSIRAARLDQQGRGLARRPDPLGARGDGKPSRFIHDAKSTESFEGPVVRAEEAPATGDAATDEAFDGLGATYDLLWEQFARDSIDDEGMDLHAHVHYGVRYDNAFWDGQRMVFGDGDGELFNRFTIALDVIGHELAHGVTEDEAGLRYWQQSGALNESVSDVFGSLVKQHKLQQKAEDADWLIGQGLLAPGVRGVALRSMSKPGSAYDDPVLGKDPQPATMDDYVRTVSDNGGVHINSGIPNHAFYLVATSLGGFAWERAGRIWYETLRNPRLKPSAQFRTFARLTIRVAGRLYGERGDEATAVREAWNKVKLQV